MSIELPNGTIHRNIQEQVAQNMNDIAKLKKIIADYNIADYVINVGSTSGTITEQDLTVAEQDLAFIVYAGELYVKSYDDGTNIYFNRADIDSSSADNITTVSQQAFQIVKATRAYSQITNTLITGYSVENINTLLAQKANISGAAFTGDITAPSIIEDMAGYSFLKEETENITIDYIYCGIVKNGNKLTLVYSVEITRTGDLTGSSFPLGTFVIPYSIGEKLYPTTGNWLKIDKSYAGQDYFTGVDVPILLIKSSNTSIFARVYNANALLTLNQRYFLRYEATFLLSDNLAV